MEYRLKMPLSSGNTGGLKNTTSSKKNVDSPWRLPQPANGGCVRRQTAAERAMRQNK
jgi:hypothetical protein